MIVGEDQDALYEVPTRWQVFAAAGETTKLMPLPKIERKKNISLIRNYLHFEYSLNLKGQYRVYDT